MQDPDDLLDLQKTEEEVINEVIVAQRFSRTFKHKACSVKNVKALKRAYRQHIKEAQRIK